MKLTADALNHLLRQNTWAAEQLRPFAGKVVCISIPPLHNTLLLDGAGEFSTAAPESVADATIHLSPSAALRAMLQPEQASSLATLEGDMALASAVGKVLRGLRWDAEEDLSRLIGDIPAHHITQSTLRIKQEITRQAWSVAGMFSEYWLEEQPLIAKGRHLEAFGRDVDTLRADADRLAKRIEALEQKR